MTAAPFASQREQIQDDLNAPLSYDTGVEAQNPNELPTKNYVDGLVGSGGVRYDLSAQIPAQGDVYLTPTNFTVGTMEMWVNGLYQSLAAAGHFTEQLPNHVKFNDFPLILGDELVVRYIPAP